MTNIAKQPDLDSIALAAARQIEAVIIAEHKGGPVQRQARIQIVVTATVKAERERCAKIAENFRDYTGAGREDTNDLIGMFGRGNRNARACIAAAIRNGEPPKPGAKTDDQATVPSPGHMSDTARAAKELTLWAMREYGITNGDALYNRIYTAIAAARGVR